MALTKPCDGKLSDELQEKLTSNRDREQWQQHRCETCGMLAAVEQVRGGIWKPEQHWPSVTISTRLIAKARARERGKATYSKAETTPEREANGQHRRDPQHPVPELLQQVPLER
jgi:hypothetical protein